jgi:hypothetical protein
MAMLRKVFSWWLYLLFSLLYVFLAALEARSDNILSMIVCLICAFLCGKMSIVAFKDRK